MKWWLAPDVLPGVVVNFCGFDVIDAIRIPRQRKELREIPPTTAILRC
jgi:hypothetical protein